MRRINKRGWLGTLTLVLACAFSLQATAQESNQPHVVLIGVSDYKDEQIKDRLHAEDDAKALYDVFTSEKYFAIKKDRVKLLLGKKDAARDSELATRENVIKAVQWLAKETDEDDLVIFAFFGQGCSLGKRGDRTCYFMVDSTLKGRSKDAVASADIGQEFDKLKSKRVCVFLDVNFKGFNAPAAKMPEVSLGKNPFQEFLGDDDTLDHAPLRGRAIFLATNGLSQAPDLEKNGLFAQAIVAGLQGAADKFGYEPDGLITIDELSDYVNDEIPNLKRKHKKLPTDPRRREDHFVIAGPSSHYVVSKNAGVRNAVDRQLEKFRDVAKTLSKEVADEGERFLERMPKLKAQRELRKEYQKLVDAKITKAQLLAAREKVLKSMRLEPSVAAKFATVIMQAVDKLDEEYFKKTNSGELVAAAVRGMYERIDEIDSMPAEVKKKLAKAKDLNKAELLGLLRDARRELGKREDLDEHKDVDHALQRMLARLDPYTTYIDPAMLERFNSQTTGRLSGIGVQIRKDLASEMLEVVTPILNSPSYKKGLQEGDLIETVIREVDGEGKKLDPPQVLHTKDLELTEAVKNIIGTPGTNVKLKIRRPGVEKPFIVEITRASIEIESVLGVRRKKDDSWDYWLDEKNRIGYVRLSNFAEKTTEDLEEVIKQLKRGGMKGFILDVRFNPGGYLSTARDVSDLFIKDGKIVSIRPRDRAGEYRISGRSPGSELDFPMICLVNGFSASASEIVSACLQDHGRAIIVGERSYGKGSVQTIVNLDGGKLKFTTATFWRPSGKNLNKSSTKGKDDEEWGVKPNKGFEVELSRKERDDLAEHQRNSEIIRRKDKPLPKPAQFKDRQLEIGLKYLAEQIADAGKN